MTRELSTALAPAAMSGVRPRAWRFGPRSADAVGAREAGREEADEERRREADDVQVVAFDALHEGGAAARDRVGARAVAPLARRDVAGHVAGREFTERDAGLLVLDDLPGRRHEAETRHDRVRPAAEAPEHGGRLLLRAGLPEDLAVQDDGRVHAEHGPLPRLAGHRPRLA